MAFSSVILKTFSNYSRQLAFAVAPIPAYLPQYYALCSSSNDPILERHVKQKRGLSSTSPEKNHDSPHFVKTHQITESGFSSTSIMILLMSHIFRLQYFLGSVIINIYGSLTEEDGEGKGDPVHFDLVTQSIVMVAMQILLLSAVTRRRRMAHKSKTDDDDEFMVGAVSPSNRESSISQRPFVWIIHPKGHWKWDTIHQYMEFIIAVTVVTYIFFRHWIYPQDFLEYIATIKVISILLESCLALPQIILNYKRKSTEGLSLVMVLGWVVGDFMKMIYFTLELSASKHEVARKIETNEGSDMTVFIFGCVFAMIMDVIVGLQVTKYYPSHDMLSLKAKIRSCWRQFEIRVLQIDYNKIPHAKQRGSMDGNDLT
ncbi:hypothetical protein CTEN210_15743 [Chaetoceros tenuissimus]|uniref:Uncharacterized protein n=1 Tax=Chaetoceros tenuissimus TaxID=426638 RepID=A0AAD3HCY8_9STRA|nr:hypothetical protein CTEN210_15743 [Chaetoceros tenuissimus]